MNEFTYTYKAVRVDTPNFHGWVVFECVDGYEEEIYSDTVLEHVKAFMNDLGASC